MSKGKVVAITSGKGGTGKTVLAINLGSALSLSGNKVVIVDADIAMADLGLYLGLEKSPVTLHEVLAGEASVEQALYDGPGGCQIMPSGLSLSGFSRANPKRLSNVVEELSRDFEFVILDCPSGLSKESSIPLSVADEVVIVVNPDLASLADALRMKMMSEALETNVKGVVINRTGVSKTEISSNEVGSMLDLDVLGVIPEDDEVKKSANLKVPVILKKKDSPASEAQIELAKKISGKERIEVKAVESKGSDEGKSKLRSILGL
jgi:septum site-determining protein MinD